jgi:hypothetical protein
MPSPNDEAKRTSHRKGRTASPGPGRHQQERTGSRNNGDQMLYSRVHSVRDSGTKSAAAVAARIGGTNCAQSDQKMRRKKEIFRGTPSPALPHGGGCKWMAALRGSPLQAFPRLPRLGQSPQVTSNPVQFFKEGPPLSALRGIPRSICSFPNSRVISWGRKEVLQSAALRIPRHLKNQRTEEKGLSAKCGQALSLFQGTKKRKAQRKESRRRTSVRNSIHRRSGGPFGRPHTLSLWNNGSLECALEPPGFFQFQTRARNPTPKEDPSPGLSPAGSGALQADPSPSLSPAGSGVNTRK